MKRKRGSGTPADQEGPALVTTVEVFGHQVRRCQWWQRSTGRQRRKAALDGGDYCKTHGGNRIQIGPANPNWKHGRWSRLLPPSMRATSPPELHHRATIEVYDGRAEALLRRIAAGGGTWSEFADAYGDLRKAMFDANSDEIRFAMDKLHQLATGTAESDALWKQFDSLMRKRAALVDSERRFALDARNVLTREQAQAHASALVAAIVKHVTDRDTLNAIMNDIRALLPMDE
jgi:hypothetical protein